MMQMVYEFVELLVAKFAASVNEMHELEANALQAWRVAPRTFVECICRVKVPIFFSASTAIFLLPALRLFFKWNLLQ